MGFEIGQRIGDYEVVSVLGAGGMGAVYKVRNVISERFEAMKVLLPNLSGDPEGADRFLREIKVQASLTHPNIAGLHTATRVDNQLLMMMEYVEGTTVESLMQRGSVGMANAVDYTMQVLSALAYAHNHGVVHRDIKPANIMLTPSGQIKLMDFGIARVAQDRRLTQTGRTVGSLFYMSPEQINGQSTDGRSDLYSLGVALYEMVTGRRPFDGDSDFSIMAAHLQQNPVPPIQLDPSVPMALNEVVMMAITKDVNARYQSADAMRMALDNVRQLMALPAGQSDSTQPYAGVQEPQYQQQQQPYAQPYAQQQAYAEPQYAPQQPYAAPPPAAYIPPPPVVMQKQKSGRGLYMAVGSLVTIGVLALAVIKGPELMKTFAGTKKDPEQIAAQGPGDPSQTPGQTPATQTPGQTPGQTPSTPADPAAQTPSQPPPQTPASQTPSEPPAKTPEKRTEPANRGPRQTTTVARNEPPPQQYQPPQQQQPPAYQPPAQQQPPQQQPPAQQAPRAPESSRALNEVREHHNELAIRAETVRQGLTSLRQQMASQGVGIRADVREAETRMNYQMREAASAIRAGDFEGAKRNLDFAAKAIESLEKFLGR